MELNGGEFFSELFRLIGAWFEESDHGCEILAPRSSELQFLEAIWVAGAPPVGGSAVPAKQGGGDGIIAV